MVVMFTMMMVMTTFINCKTMCRFQVFAKAVHGVDQSLLEPNYSIVASAHKECKVRLIVNQFFTFECDSQFLKLCCIDLFFASTAIQKLYLSDFSTLL